jgi:hypothetical protein
MTILEVLTRPSLSIYRKAHEHPRGVSDIQQNVTGKEIYQIDVILRSQK